MENKAPRGTYDILPPVSGKWQYVEQILRETAALYGFHEIRTPIFEHTELFERGVGSTTDVVGKEMYTFKDRSDRSLTLRPENTASCARALIEHSVYSGILPVKWYYMGPMFRYDRPQAGRYRQFHQFGAEVFGSNDPRVDAEIILLLLDILQRLNLSDYELHLNSVGCTVCRSRYREKLVKHITPVQERLCRDCKQRYEQNPLRVLDCKNEKCQEAIQGYPRFFDYLCEDCREHYSQVKNSLTDNGVRFIHDDRLVRGLDYYTRTAFEVHIPGIGAQSAVGGGGRYDGLVEDCGGPQVPGIGFAMGIERLLLALQELDYDNLQDNYLDVFIAVMDHNFEDTALKTLQELRAAGIRSDKDYLCRSPKAQMKYADRLGARLVILIGEEEVRHKVFTVRDMNSKKQETVTAEDLLRYIRSILVKQD
ncbi:histidine--tRNA ligase [Syntrophomonas palmitatica]|uniref:histidine--tRNA ligase n=1 Tax=Syntrophomonas palmitatica TaxID=402877 RepID=UPI0006D137BE|nr:histidine--tRNA ligase [Syntrophomonas palmitatica]